VERRRIHQGSLDRDPIGASENRDLWGGSQSASGATSSNPADDVAIQEIGQRAPVKMPARNPENRTLAAACGWDSF
jgi:hypothetical protein